MKSIFLLGALLTLSTSLFAQRQINDPNAEARTVETFHSIQVGGAFDVILSQGPQGLAVSAENKDAMERITTTVENGVLKIGFKYDKKIFNNPRKLKAYISAPSLQGINVSGASKLNIEGDFTAASMKMDLSGASKVWGTLKVSGAFDIDLSGASEANLSGTSNSLTVDASGASDLKASEFSTNTCTVDASGASIVRITVNKELSAELSGASRLTYGGTGMIRDISASGASKVSKKG